MLKIFFIGGGLLLGGCLAFLLRARAESRLMRLVFLLILPVFGGAAGYAASSQANLPALLKLNLVTGSSQPGHATGQSKDDTRQTKTRKHALTPEQKLPDAALRQLIEKSIARLNDPFFIAVLERETSRRNAAYERFEAAYRYGGRAALDRSIGQAVREIAEQAMPHYLARAQETDLLKSSRLMQGMMRDLAQSDPETCYLWLYGVNIDASFDHHKFVSVVGDARYLSLQKSLAMAVENASDFLPEYDSAYALERMQDIGTKIYTLLGDERIGIVQTGQEPSSLEEMQLACQASSIIYQDVLDDDMPTDLLRHMFAHAGSFSVGY